MKSLLNQTFKFPKTIRFELKEHKAGEYSRRFKKEYKDKYSSMNKILLKRLNEVIR